MTDYEINIAVCKALGWEEPANDTWPDEIRWRVPPEQPWNKYYSRRRVDYNPSDCPDFLNDPAESWRLMVWAGIDLVRLIGVYPAGWRAISPDSVTNDRHEWADIDPARALVLAFLASRGVEVKDG